MRKRGLCASKKIIFGFSLGLFFIFTIFLIVAGSFYWDGGNTAYLNTNTVLRGLELLSGTFLLLCLFGLAAKALSGMKKEKIRIITAVFGLLMVVFQFVFVAVAKAGIRYDALKVLDEALALFAQKGMQAADLEGYFARYSNNYAMTIMTHWFIKIFRMTGIIRPDFSNAVLVLQFVNIIFTDIAFAGAYALLKRFAGEKAGAVFVIYMAWNPLSYVWMPFYYTNTCSMAFAVWGAYLLFSVFMRKPVPKQEDGAGFSSDEGRSFRCSICKCVLAGILFAAGFQIRATVGIALIAAVITIWCFGERKQETVKKQLLRIVVYLIVLLLSMGITRGVYGKIERHYLAFDESDSEFPMTHWIAMGLSDTGTFSPADEAYTMSFADREGKKEATVSLLKERAAALGPAGVAKLYFKKLAMTFGDGAGGYHSELSISRDYGVLWQIVYGVHRDPLLSVTQIFYLFSLVSGAGTAVLLWKRKLHGVLFFLPLLLLGSYLFQMIWEAGTIYSIGTMYVNGCVAAVFVSGISIKDAEAVESRDKKKIRFSSWWGSKGAKAFFYGLSAVCILMCGLLVRSFFVTDYVEVSMSVDQFLFQANEYIALSDGMELVQTFVTDKEFSTIALQVHNPEGEFNDSLYSVSLCDGEGKLIQEEILEAAFVKDYIFYPLAFTNEAGVSSYEIRIRKLSGKNDLVFLYYDTGHYDVYPEGKMTGITKGDMADLIFEVYWREDMESPAEK